MAVRIADVVGLVSDLVDLYRSAHEAFVERRRNRKTRAAQERAKKTANSA